MDRMRFPLWKCPGCWHRLSNDFPENAPSRSIASTHALQNTFLKYLVGIDIGYIYTNDIFICVGGGFWNE